MKRKISLGAVDYIVDCAANTSQRPKVGVLGANWVNNIHGAVFGTVV